MMPCDSSYMEASTWERDTSRVQCLLDELDGKSWKESDWEGYHEKVYGKITQELADKLVSKLCAKLQGIDVKNYSLEMQIWWRDHQKADKQRIEHEVKEKKTAKARKDEPMTQKDHEMLLALIKAGRGHLALCAMPVPPLSQNYFCIGPIDAPVLSIPCGNGMIPKINAASRKVILAQLAKGSER